MLTTPRGMRLHISLFGRRNVGKSAFLNALTGQDVAIVSEVPGTTTDPVEKAMELLPIGPVLLTDTAGLDDPGHLGGQRVRKSEEAMRRTDVAIVIADGADWGDFEQALVERLAKQAIPVIVAFNKSDLGEPTARARADVERLGVPAVCTSATRREGFTAVREALVRVVPEDFLEPPPLVGDLVAPGELIVLVVPIDLEAPKGRLILPQVQTIRDALDHDARVLVVKERELREALEGLKRPPALVVTDSQAFLKVAGDTPADVPMTSFSILFARAKGDLATFAEGARAIDRLRTGSRVLIAEACTHHPVGEDIGRVKIPRWLTQYAGGRLDVAVTSGRDFPADLASYALVVHCGSCTMNRREVLSRILQCRAAGVPITNYGLAIAYSLGIFERALAPFPGVLECPPTNGRGDR